MKVKSGYDFDDVLLIPKKTNLNSRDQVDLNSNYFEKSPIISSPMKGVSGIDLVEAMDVNGCMGILHRFDTIENRKKQIDELTKRQCLFGISIGIRDYHEEELLDYVYDISNCPLICIDVANGYIPRYIQFVKDATWFQKDIMAGNVATLDGAKALADVGAKFIRVGIGPGRTCITRNVTGVGVPQLTAIEECAKVKKYHKNVFIVADGGIRNSGDAVKAFAVGADFVMLGTLLAGTKEADNDGNIYGMASEHIQINFTKKVKSVEGLELKIENEKVSVQELIEKFLYGIRSACTYINAYSYLDIKNNASFVLAGTGSIKAI